MAWQIKKRALLKSSFSYVSSFYKNSVTRYSVTVKNYKISSSKR